MGRFDWGATPPQPGFVMQAGFALDTPGMFADIWSWGGAPGVNFGPVSQYPGNGGEVYVVSGHMVRISVTQDGGKKDSAGKPYLQGFYGAHCGGTGWIAFRDDAPTGSWKTVTASLKGLPVPSTCAASSKALTRYRLEDVQIPFGPSEAGTPILETLPCIISDHFNTGSLSTASALERSIWCKGVGRAVWEAWSTKAPPVDPSPRCPGSNAPAVPAGWKLADCHYATRLVAAPDPAMTGDAFGWPPVVGAMP